MPPQLLPLPWQLDCKMELGDRLLLLQWFWLVLYVLLNQVMYDATGVRQHAGRQAELLNQIVCELPPEHPVASVRPLRDSLGHTPLQVLAGALLGCLVAYLMRRSS
nr:Acid phosphatase/vanadium-dependent haloperoxidase-related protein [Ipomoea batatas]